MEREEIVANDNEELEKRVKAKEEEGWVRQGEVEVIHSEPDKNGAVTITVLQVMTKGDILNGQTLDEFMNDDLYQQQFKGWEGKK